MNSQNGLSHGIHSLGKQDGFLCSFDANGNTQWLQNVGDTAIDYPYLMVKENCTNRVYFSGSTNGLSSFDGSSINLPKYHAFVSHYSYDNSCMGNINPLPSINVNSAIICNGASAILNATGASTYSWVPNIGLSSTTGANINASPNTTIIYSVNASDALNCPYVGTTTVTVNATPTLSVNSATICAGDSATLTVSGTATSYTWSTSATTTSISVTPTITTTYTVTGANVNGCVDTATASINIKPLPIIIVNNGDVCAGSSFTLAASGANTYTYNSGSAVVTPTTNTTYIIAGTNTVTACSNMAISTVTVNTLPTITASSNTTSICVGETATLTANGATTYTWSNNATTNTVAIIPTISTTYTVMGTDGNGCTNNDTLSIIVENCITGINNVANQNNINIYPNPNNGTFVIEPSNSTKQTMQMFDVNGKMLLSQPITDKTSIDASNLNEGVYNISLQSNEGVVNKRLVIVR